MVSENRFNTRRINISLLFFVISSFYGLLLHTNHVHAFISNSYKDVLQAHSHVTFLGWGFLAVITLVTASFVEEKIQRSYYFKVPFWVMITCLIGLLISFPLQGYAFFSIFFLSVFLLASYTYLWSLFKNLKHNKSYSSRFVKTGILYYYISSLGIWGLAYVSSKYGKGDLYQNAINFYTHFLYNGFFVLVLFGLFFRYLERKQIDLRIRSIKWFYRLTSFAVMPAFALSLLWKSTPNYIVIIGFVGVLIQLFSLYYLYRIAKLVFVYNWIQKKSKNGILLGIVLFALSLKIALQFLGSFPEITLIAMLFKPYFVIGYIHLFTIGFLSVFLFLLINLLMNEKAYKWEIFLFLFGFMLSETILFSQGLLVYLNREAISDFNEIMLTASFMMFLGLILLFKRRIFYKERP